MVMQKQSELPEGWELVSFKDILKINPSKPPKDVVPQNTPVTFVPMPAVDADSGAITAPKIKEFSKVRKGYTAFQNEDVIFAKITPCMENGKAAIARNLLNNFGFGSTEFIVFRSKGAILPDYLYNYIRQESYRKLAESKMTGSVGQKRVPKEFVQNSSIPLPSLAEQHRIVSAIEALFARLDAANERLDRVPEILKTFRQSVLAAACDGRLTEEWREENPHVEKSSEYLEKIKVEKSTKPNKHEKFGDVDYPNSIIIPDKWSGVKIGEIETFIGSGITPKGGRSVYVNEGIPFIRSQNVYPKGLILDDIAYVTPEMHQKMKRTNVFSGDVLLNITGASIGRSTYVPENFGEANVNQHVCIIRCGWWILPRYFSMFLNSDRGQSQIFKMQTGQTREGLNYTQIRNMFVALPPLPEQHEIVRRVDALFALADSIEAKVATAREKTEKLRQSILSKAFSGELVETEAELARREGREYETAEVLLERIKSEQGMSGKKGEAAK